MGTSGPEVPLAEGSKVYTLSNLHELLDLFASP